MPHSRYVAGHEPPSIADPPRRRLIRRFWSRVQEPRSVSIVQTGIYLCVMVGGILTHIQPPQTVSEIMGQSVVLGWGIIMAVGGAASAVACILGWRWLERLGIILLFIPWGMYVATVIEAHLYSTGFRWKQLTWLAVAGLSLVVRFLRIWRAKYNLHT